MKRLINVLLSGLCLLFLVPESCLAAIGADIVENGKHATVYASGTSSFGKPEDEFETVWLVHGGRAPSIPLSRIRVSTNCQVKFREADRSGTHEVSISAFDEEVPRKIFIPKHGFIDMITYDCTSYLFNKTDEDVNLGHLNFLVIKSGRVDSSGRELMSFDIKKRAKLYSTSSCTLSIPEPVVNITGSAQNFQTGLSRKIKIESSCKGPSSATVFLNGEGVIDSEGCIAVNNTADDTDSLRMCATGFSFDATKGKSIQMDNDGKSSDEIEFTLSSHDHQLPAPGEYKSVVYAVISPS
ncbi:hypothetical protein GKQ23_19490 [Erwinia sp. E602]|uniref:hypothetical protein n=1 Tax=Erwinia sp. E602 TaxID=2675378 RepID=UPI001BA98412|nr:hypothetical protein [Erwinia sp. E602]QUG77042.1 hypothetical protein GKQ23_19490 [Erwinia sp. E602]